MDDKFDNSFLLTPSITCHKQDCQEAGSGVTPHERATNFYGLPSDVLSDLPFDNAAGKADTEYTKCHNNGIVASILWIELDRTNQIKSNFKIACSDYINY